MKVSVYCKDNIIYKINEEFTKLTNYTQENVVGKSFSELSTVLKINKQAYSEEDENIYSGYIFNTEDVPKYVDIICENSIEENEKIYYMVERPSRLLEGILATCTDDDRESVAIYSYPEIVHLKFNKKYYSNFKTLDKEYYSSLGSVYLNSEAILNNLGGKRSYYIEQVEALDINGEIRYWSINVNTIFEEGEAKYLRCTYIDETEKVQAIKEVEKQNKEMEIILDNIPDVVIKLNSKGEYTYRNKANVEELVNYGIGDIPLTNKEVFDYLKYNDIDGRELSFDETPDARVLAGEKLTNYIIVGTDDMITSYHECNGTPIYDEEGNVESAVLVYRDIEDKFKLEEYYALAENIKNIAIKYAILSYEDFKIKYINNNIFQVIKRMNSDVNSIVEIMGKNFFEFYKLDEGAKCFSISA